MSKTIAGIRVPDSQLATEATELLRASASPMLFNHSLRVYMFGALHGARHGRSVDHELLYLGAVFHDFGLIKKYSSPKERFELDGANAARRFLVERGVPQTSVEIVWDAIALHNTLEIPKYKRPEIELVYEGVNVDVLGMGFQEIADSAREEVLAAFPRLNFKDTMPRTFAEAIFHKPQTGWANTMGDAVERFLPGYVRPNFCDIIAGTPFRD
jgi:HD domain